MERGYGIQGLWGERELPDLELSKTLGSSKTQMLYKVRTQLI